MWFLISVLRQFFTAPRVARVAQLGAARLTPRFHLFCADLSRLDVYMYVRDFHEDGSLTGWREITPSGRNGGMRLTFSNRRMVYAFTQTAHMIVGLMKTPNPNVMDLESPRDMMAKRCYQLLLHYARSQRASASVERRQFLVAERSSPHATDEDHTGAFDFPFPDRAIRVVTPFHEIGERPVTI